MASNLVYHPRTDEPSLRNFCLILQDKRQDECNCPCSLSRCFAVTCLLYRILHGYTQFGPYKMSEFVHFLSETISGLEDAPLPDVAAAIIRFLIFELLRIPHTYTHHEEELRSSEAIEELRDDWREQIARQEELVCKFQAIYEASALPLSEFLETTWLEDVQKLLDDEHRLNSEELGLMRELRVV